MILALDIETNLAHDRIWCCGIVTDTGVEEVVRSPERLIQLISQTDVVLGHNIIEFDYELLRSLWSVSIPKEKVKDTILMSRLWNPRIQGGHSLKAWGLRFNNYKGDFTDFDAGYSEEMAEYCLQDTKIAMELYKYLDSRFKVSDFSEESVELEHQVQWIVAEQVRNGFKLDEDKATQLYQMLWARMVNAQDKLQEVFPPIIEKRTHKTTGKPLPDKVTEFNPGSRKQIAERLLSTGVKLTEQTEKGAWKIDETVLEAIDTPEAKLLLDYFLCQKRTGQIDQWLSHVKDGRVHGKVYTNGAVTGRMTHNSPNMAQVPGCKHYGKEHPNAGQAILGFEGGFGVECRECWTVDEGNVLVGIDASGLELRMLAHYMDDKDYTAEVVNGDVHTKNQEAAGLPDRDTAKTFIYAFLYGAGAAKIGSIVGGSSKTGTNLKNKFLQNTPALSSLIKRVRADASKGSIKGLDGRKLRIESEHAALNTLLQGAGAIVMKKALVIFKGLLDERNIPAKIVGNIHDEWQVECPECFGNAVGRLGVKAIVQAGEYYRLNCPLDGEYKVGKTWAETH